MQQRASRSPSTTWHVALPGTDAAGDAEAGPGRGGAELWAPAVAAARHERGEVTPWLRQGLGAWLAPQPLAVPAGSAPSRAGAGTAPAPDQAPAGRRERGAAPAMLTRRLRRAQGAGAGSAGSVPKPALSSACCRPY